MYPSGHPLPPPSGLPSLKPAVSPAADAGTAPALPPSAGLALQANRAPLTRVALATIEPHFNLYLRFGEPAHTLRLDRWRRWAVFLPGAVLCRIRWQANDYGTVRWQLMVMQACTPLEDRKSTRLNSSH